MKRVSLTKIKVKLKKTHISTHINIWKRVVSMEIKINKTLILVMASIFSLLSMPSYSTPKAAENENAPVTSGADVTRPKISVKPTKTPTPKEKKSATRKTHRESSSSKTKHRK